LLRTMPLVGPLNEEMKSFVETEFLMASKRKRFNAFYPPHIATDLGIGLEIMTIHRVLVEKAPPSAVDQAAMALLVALGIDTVEAEKLATERIPRSLNMPQS